MSRRVAGPSLDDRLAALRDGIATAEGRVPDELLAAARAVGVRAGERRARGDQAVVVALCGGAGTGKSSLFNAFAGRDLAEVDVRRPTSDAATAWAVGDPDELDPLLDWLEIGTRNRHLAPHGATPDGLVLLDVPDIDSVEDVNHTTANRLIERVDVLIWVVDPHKYAQRSLHEGYLIHLREHAEVMVVVLNHADRLRQDEARTIRHDLQRLLGGGDAPRIIAASALTGEGVEQLRKVITREVTERRAVARRIAADVRVAATDLLRALEPADSTVVGERRTIVRRRRKPDAFDPEELTEGLVRLADVEGFAEQARETYVASARRAIRTPVLRLTRLLGGLVWSLLATIGLLGRLALVQRPHLASRRSSAPAVSQLDVRHTLLRASERARASLPWFWAERVSSAMDRAGTTLPTTLKSALAEIPLQPPRRRWWTPTTVLWIAAEIGAVAGIVWILVLPLVTIWLQLPPVPVPKVNDEVSLPGLLIAIGTGVWIVVALIRRFAIRAGAVRHRNTVRRQSREAVRTAVHDTAVAPLQHELDAYRLTRDRLAVAAT